MAHKKHGVAFITYAQSRADARRLREAMEAVRIPRVTAFDKAARKLVESGHTFYVDLSGHAYPTMHGLHEQLSEAGYGVHIYVKEARLPLELTEAWVRQQSTYGLIRQHLRESVHIVRHARHAAAHAYRLMEAEGAAPKPKAPSEVDRMKVQQKQQELMLKQRQSNDLMQAKQRELQKKSREDQQKLQSTQQAKPAAR